MLDDYRLSFGEAYDAVVRTIRNQLKLEPTGRPAKSTSSLVEKLHRESIRLSQVQDIAGCRVVVGDVAKQDQVVASLEAAFAGASVVDRRTNPSYGYRAVHVIAQISGKLIEIQVRTALQHLWAEYSEALSDEFDTAIKYGGGEDRLRQMLTATSATVAELETFEKKVAPLPQLHGGLVDEKPQPGLQHLREQVAHMKQQLAHELNNAIFRLESLKGHKQ
jgi:putative GTP pyrophosphokinase